MNVEMKHRGHPLYAAFVLHRVSGILLAVFLPLHFYVLSLALNSPESLDGFLTFAENQLVKFAEFGLVFLLAAHMFGGLRLMVLEWFPWSGPRKALVAGAIALSFFISGIFLLQAV